MNNIILDEISVEQFQKFAESNTTLSETEIHSYVRYLVYKQSSNITGARHSYLIPCPLSVRRLISHKPCQTLRLTGFALHYNNLFTKNSRNLNKIVLLSIYTKHNQ
jgi:hypothetical protein